MTDTDNDGEDTDNNGEETETSITLQQFNELLDNNESKLHRDARHIVHCIETAVELRIQADKISQLGDGKEVCDDQLETLEEAVSVARQAADEVWPTDTMPDLIEFAEARFDVAVPGVEDGGHGGESVTSDDEDDSDGGAAEDDG